MSAEDEDEDEDDMLTQDLVALEKCLAAEVSTLQWASLLIQFRVL